LCGIEFGNKEYVEDLKHREELATLLNELPATIVLRTPIIFTKTIVGRHQYFVNGCKLGSGGFSTVVIGERMNGQEIVAIKKLNMDQYRMCEVDVLEREVQTMKQMMKQNNINIIKFHEHISEGEDQYFIFEHCDESLQKAMNQRKLTPSEILHVFQSIANGMKELHSQNIIHRDLKPDNILINKDSQTHQILDVKITDFTTSKFLEKSQSHMTTNVGTIDFQAPEVLEHGGKHSFEADYYSLGVIVHQLMFSTFPSNPISPNTPQWIQGMLTKDPKERKNPWNETIITLEMIQNVTK